jgi:hypothetical protein
MEKLGRGLVAVKSGSGYLVSWRLFGLEQGTDIAFNLYKGGAKLNSAPITNSTNYSDNGGGSGEYTLKVVKGGVEQEQAEPGKAMVLANNYLEIPLKAASGRSIHLAYVADLDGDGEYEYVVDRTGGSSTQYFEAYHRTTGFMWRVDMGPNSTNQANQDPGAAAIGCGHADNEGAYDIDCDGFGEAICKGANGTIFGDGKVFSAPNNTNGYIMALDGRTGALKSSIEVPHDLDKTWSCTGHFSIAYWDGVHPGLMFKAKAGGAKTMADYAYDWDMTSKGWKLRWNSGELSTSAFPNNHNIRCPDVDGDGIDEYINGGYCRKADGTVLWNQAAQGVIHGDRWHVGKFDPDRVGLQGMSISQRNPKFDMCYYDATDGKLIRTHGNSGTDIARGNVGDCDASKKGMEYGSSAGTFNGPTGAAASGSVGGNFRIWWNGDLLSETLDGNTAGGTSLPGIFGPRNAAPLYGDMFGDWREEVLLEQSGGGSMRVYTTTIPTDKRIYCLMHDPYYRNSMTEKGYMQSHHLDYYLGMDMTDPPAPKIIYAGDGVAVLPGPDTRKTGRVLASSEGASMMVMAGKSFTIPGASAIAQRSMSVYTCSGELVARGKVNGNNVDLEKQFGLSNSMFVVKISQKGGI